MYLFTLASHLFSLFRSSLTYQFTRMPFGFAIASRVFTRLTRVVAKILVARGVRYLMYFDDWLLAAPSEAEAQEAVSVVLQIRVNGFSSELGKSFFSLTRRFR